MYFKASEYEFYNKTLIFFFLIVQFVPQLYAIVVRSEQFLQKL